MICEGRGMFFGDYMKFLRRNSAPHANLAALFMGREPFDIATIIDEHKYERHYRNYKYSLCKPDDWILTGHSWNDYMRYCFVCNVAWHNGETPHIGWEGEYDDDKGDWVTRPARGLRACTEVLLIEGCLRPSQEVFDMCRLDRRDGLSKTPTWCRLYA